VAGLADLFGRRRLFLVGGPSSAVASATLWCAISPGVWFASRFVQGLGEAFAAPASLGLDPLLFTDRVNGSRGSASGVGSAGLGGTTGTIISGVLTNYARGAGDLLHQPCPCWPSPARRSPTGIREPDEARRRPAPTTWAR